MYRRILVPLDGSKLAECVIPHVEEITRCFNSESVTFIRVAESVHIPSVEGDAIIVPEESNKIESEHAAEAKKYLSTLADRLKWDKHVLKTVVLPPGSAAESLVQYAKENQVDLIVIATHGRSGVARWFLGSVAEKVLRLASMPVLMVRAC